MRHVQCQRRDALHTAHLRQELVLELLREAQVEVVLLRQRLRAHHCLHGHHVAAGRVVGVPAYAVEGEGRGEEAKGHVGEEGGGYLDGPRNLPAHNTNKWPHTKPPYIRRYGRCRPGLLPLLGVCAIDNSHLVGDRAVVVPGHALADGGLHETRQRRQHVDGRVDLRVVQRAVHVDLALRDVARQVGDGVRDVVVGHRQDGELGDAAVGALQAGGQVTQAGQNE